MFIVDFTMFLRDFFKNHPIVIYHFVHRITFNILVQLAQNRVKIKIIFKF